jgi:hypothetical protein
VEAGQADGIGFVLTDDDPYTCIDLDRCRDPETGVVELRARAIVENLNSYTEISPSGTGLHAWVEGTIPGKRNRIGKIEMYSSSRFMIVTGRAFSGYDVPIRAAQIEVDALYNDLFSRPAPEHNQPPAILTFDDQEIRDRLAHERNGHGISVALLAGDHGAYQSPSEARAALAFKCCFYTDDPEQIARILLTSELFSSEDSDRERYRKAYLDARSAVADYRGPQYDTTRSRAEPRSAQGHDPLARREVLEGIQVILASNEIEAGPRLTAIGVLLECVTKLARGEAPTEHGYHIPASWIARRTGHSPKTVSAHLRKLAACSLIDRTVVREKIHVSEETVDSDGVIQRDICEVNGKRNYIAFPTNVSEFTARFAAFRRADDQPRHGGERVVCQDHPTAGTYTELVTRCQECHAIVDSGDHIWSDPPNGTVPDQSESTSKMALDTHVGNGIPKMGHDPSSDVIETTKSRGTGPPAVSRGLRAEYTC